MAIHFGISVPGASLPGDRYPSLASLRAPIPQTSLVGCWHAQAGVTLDDASRVSSWRGFRGGVVAPATEAAKPAYQAAGMATGKPSVLFDGSSDRIALALAPPSAGYIVVKMRVPADLSGGQTRTLLGAETSSTARLRIGTSLGKVVAAIGSLTFTDLLSTTSALAGDTLVVGLSWDGSTASLRINGTEEDSGSYTGSVGTTAFALGSNSNSTSYSYSHVALVGIYSTDPGTLDLDAIDSAAAAY